MKAEELRIGNWIRSKDYKKEYQVAANTITEIIQRNLAGTQIHYPIPLTEEWLVKFGFEKDRHNYKRTLSKVFVLDVSINGSVYFWSPNGDLILMPLVVEYVHQLQNLYFALTGEELTPNKTDKK